MHLGRVAATAPSRWHQTFNPETLKNIAGNYFMEWSMLWKDLLIGLLIAGIIAAFVPQGVFDILSSLTPNDPNELIISYSNPNLAHYKLPAGCLGLRGKR